MKRRHDGGREAGPYPPDNSWLECFADFSRVVQHPARKTPFIVIPGEDPDKATIHDMGLRQVGDRAVRVMVEIDRDEGPLVDPENALHRPLGGGLQERVDFLRANVAVRGEAEIDNRHVGCRNADRRALHLAAEMR